MRKIRFRLKKLLLASVAGLFMISTIPADSTSISGKIGDAMHRLFGGDTPQDGYGGPDINGAETAAAEAVKAEQAAKETLANLEGKLKKAKGDTTELKKQIAEAKADLAKKTEQRMEAAEKLIEAYRDLGDYYQRAGQVGDPVQIATGDYVYTKTDFEAEDFLSKLSIFRNYNVSSYSESFGKNWTCSLDSRIVRGKNHEVGDLITKLNSQKSAANEYITQLNKFKEIWGHYPDEAEDPISEIQARIDEIDEELDFQNIINEENKVINERNKYAAYGYYSNPDNLIIGSDMLVFIDEDGNRIICKNSDNNLWIPVNKKKSVQFYIEENNGYAVIYRNGVRKEFSKYGILEKIEDRNKNKTIFESSNGLISKIKNKTGEEINIERNSKNQIIKIHGNTSGTAQFLYNQDYMIYVCSNKNAAESYSYNDSAMLCEIKTGDKNSIKINYEYYNDANKKLVSDVTNQIGDKEYFSYDLKNHKVFHTTYSGVVETYELNEDGSTKFYENDAGQQRKFQFDDKNQISGIYENSRWKYYSYNENYEPVSIHFDDGVSTSTEYNELGQITFQSDKDGFTNEFIYDENGNLIESKFCGNTISSIEYYPNGMVKKVIENQTEYYYEYNKFGNITKRTVSCNTSDAKTELWSYDSKNRLSKYTNFDNQSIKYSYDDNSMTEISSNKKTIHHYDYRNLEIGTDETDLKSGKTISKKIIYDAIQRPLEIKLNDKKFRTYTYDKTSLMTSCTTWDLSDETKGIKRKYEYDDKNRLIKEESCFVSQDLESENEILYEVSYEDLSDGFVMNVRKGKMDAYKYYYNNLNQLVKILNPDGKLEKRTYTKNGKIDSIATENEHIDFCYTNDGNTEIEITNYNSTVENLVYNNLGQLVLRKASDGSEWRNVYDSNGLLMEESGPGYLCVYNYDNQNRKISEKVFDKFHNIIFVSKTDYDDKNLSVTRTEGNRYVFTTKYDCWGRAIESENENGTTKYSYDTLGNCTEKKSGNGKVTKYEYDSFGNLLTESVNDKIVLENKWSSSGKILLNSEFGFIKNQWNYDESGNCIGITDAFGNNQSFTVNSMGYVTSVNQYDYGTTNIDFDSIKNKMFFTDDTSIIYTEEFDDNKNLLAEINAAGEKMTYSYDDSNRLVEKLDFEGNIYCYKYDTDSLSEKTVFNNSEEYEITKNPLGLITQISTPEGTIDYVYDTGARLIEIKDNISRMNIFYEYDYKGRCIGKKGDSFNIRFDYDSTGKLSELTTTDNNASMKIEYDVSGREIKRVLSNGVIISSEYDSLGQKVSSFAKEPYGVIITGDYIVYDENGKKKLNIDKNGKITRYSYDNSGRLISTVYNYSDEIIKSAMNEAIECGIYISDERPKGCVLNLSYDEYDKAASLLRKSGIYASIDRFQYCWFEKYTYTNKGNIESVENPFGTIIYEYDSENRLVKKHGKQTVSGGVKYEWTKNGNLKSIESSKNSVKYKYGLFNRPIYVLARDYESGNVTETTYSYDALGRRISESVNGIENHRFVYDGFSHEILINTPVSANKSSVMNYSINSGISESDDYRTLSLKEYENGNNFKTSRNIENESASVSNQQLCFDNSACISVYANGTPCAYFYPSNVSKSDETEFIVMDNTSTSVKSIIDKNGNCIDIHDYNTWGEPCSKNQLNGKAITVSSSINTLKSSVITYDLGNRDYIPSMKSFTSKDPAKAGFNWYAFCPCDPVNYKDVLGFEKDCLSPYAQARYKEGVTKHLKFDEGEYHRTGSSAGISTQYDCADVSGAVDANASTYAGLSGYSKMADAYRNKHNSGNYAGARTEINSWSFFTGDTDSNVRQTSEGFNRNEYRKGNGQVAERAAAYESLQNPDIVSPGTVLVWKNPDHVDGKNWIGHTMTVLARDFDADGNVIGFAYIEGHVTGNKTELGYMGTNSTWKAGIATVDYWIGEFLGTFEIEGRSAIVTCSY